MKGNQLILSRLGIAVTFNGKEILLQTEGSELYIEGVVHAKRHTVADWSKMVALGTLSSTCSFWEGFASYSTSSNAT